jgi:dCTP deaminase
LVLSRPDILSYLEPGRLRFAPEISLDQVAQVSVDLRLGRKFSQLREPPGWLTAIKVDPSLWTSSDLWDHREQETFRLKPGEFVLAQTLERVGLPNDVMGLVEGRRATPGWESRSM